MKAGEIITEWRHEVDDTVEPFLWSDIEALDYLNEAENEACRRTRALIDSSTTAICSLTVTTTGLVALDSRVLFVRKARIAAQRPMRRMNMQDMEAHDPYWQDATATTYPSAFIPDYETGKLKFYPPPSATVTVLLTVVRDPLAAIANMDTAPEINARYHRQLKHWMSHRGYSKPDEETYNPKKSLEALALFEAEFGQRSSAIDEMWVQREQFEGDGDVLTMPKFTAFAGIRNTLPAERLHALPTKDDPTCDLVEAVNVDLDNSGQPARRAGLTSKRAGAAHSLWSDDIVGWLFVSGTTLYRLYPDYTTAVLATGLTADLPMAYVEVNGRVYWSNGIQSGVIADGRNRSWGMDIPAPPGLSKIGGYLTAGKYQVLYTYLRADGQESGAGLPGQINLEAEGGIRATWNLPSDTGIDRVQVYLSEPNGMVLYAAGQPVDVDDLYTEVSTARLALPLNTQWMDKPPAGHLLAYANGRIYIAQDGFIFASTALGYEYVDLRDFTALDGSRLRFLIGVAGGLFAGTGNGVAFLAGRTFEDMTITWVSTQGGVAGSAIHVDGKQATGISELAGKQCAMFTAGDGVFVGLPDGTVMNLTQERYRFTATPVGAAGFRQNDTLNQYLLFLQA